MNLTLCGALALAMAGAAGCTRTLAPPTPSGFANLSELRDQDPYDYRATSADGVVLAARRLPHEPRAEASFWIEAIASRLRQHGGYALLARSEVTSKDGVRGTKLRFGHDQNGKPYLYDVVLFVGPGALVLVEAGGSQAAVEKHQAALDAAIAGLALGR